MSAKAVREYHGKRLLARHISTLSPSHAIESRSAFVSGATDIDALPTDEPWLLTTALVVKPDQLIKRRGKAGLVGINLSYDEVKEWIVQRMGKEITIEGTVTGKLDRFIVEPFIPHDQSDEHYVCIQSSQDGDVILFCKDGGVDVGDVDAKANKLEVMIDQDLTEDAIVTKNLLDGVPVERKDKLCGFLAVLFHVYRKLHFVSVSLICFVDYQLSHSLAHITTELYKSNKIRRRISRSIRSSLQVTETSSPWTWRPRLTKLPHFYVRRSGGTWTFLPRSGGRNSPRRRTFAN